MRGIAGLLIRDPKLEPELGSLLAKLTSTLDSRRPDSAGFAIYTRNNGDHSKITISTTSNRRIFLR